MGAGEREQMSGEGGAARAPRKLQNQGRVPEDLELELKPESPPSEPSRRASMLGRGAADVNPRLNECTREVASRSLWLGQTGERLGFRCQLPEVWTLAMGSSRIFGAWNYGSGDKETGQEGDARE